MLRYQGLDYKKIADEVGLSRDLVRGYCLRNGLGGCGTELIAQYHKVMEEEFISIRCLNCGSEIEQNSLGRKKKYCSIHCKQEWEKTYQPEVGCKIELHNKKIRPLIKWPLHIKLNPAKFL